MPDAILIAGYYRSGTSALSGALQRAGVKFYNDAEPNEHNPLGFYEIPELIELDVELFTQLGVDWMDVRGLPKAWDERAELAPFLARLEEIIRRRFTKQDRIWGLKHPHLCRTLPLYEQAIRQAGHKPHVIHIFRNPWASAASQHRKNGLSRAHALLLWLSYTIDAERQARHLPRSWVIYEELLEKPASELKRIQKEIGLRLQGPEGSGLAEASAYLTMQLNRAEPMPQDDLSAALRELVKRCWAAIQDRNYQPELWDRLAAETADLSNLLSEIVTSRAPAMPGIGQAMQNAAARGKAVAALRPAERMDAAAQARLAAMQAKTGKLPRLNVLIAAPAGRAHAVNETLESLRGQWLKPETIKILSADSLDIEGVPVIHVPAAPEEITRQLCLELNQDEARADYSAILNAGDKISPDGCLRMALLAAQSQADIIYSDEIVPRDGGAWVRHKPGWDVTRLRQAAYLGDWVWYRTQSVRAAGGFNPDMAGAEEYDLQLRLAAQGARVERLSEAIFTRAAHSKRDDISVPVFCGRAAAAITRHLADAGIPADVENRQHPGLFQHKRASNDSGTSLIMLCDGAETHVLDKWLTALLSGKALTGPVILAGSDVSHEMARYLHEVDRKRDALQGKVLALLPAPSQGTALSQALALAQSELVAILDARMLEISPHWQEALRARLADEKVAAAAARCLTPMAADGKAGQIFGPVIIGAEARMGAGHGPQDPGPGGWLLVDQEASAITPPGLLARRAALAGCIIQTHLTGDALWIDLCAQLRANGARLVWTPDVTLVMPADAAPQIDAQLTFRTGSPAAQALPWADPYHHPALSLGADVLAPEPRTGLIRAAPRDEPWLLMTGEPSSAGPALNAARTLREAGMIDADWAQDLPKPAEVGRCAPELWLRVNPAHPALPVSPGYAALFTKPPVPAALPVLAQAQELYATSPVLLRQLQQLVPQQQISLWRPALSRKIWQDFQSGMGLNTKPRLLWVDEAISPPWVPELINETQDIASWIIIGQQNGQYPQNIASIAMPDSEAEWARVLAQFGPQILLRPAGAESYADYYLALLGAAAGCHLLIDNRLDLPENFTALRLPNEKDAWGMAIRDAIANLPETLRQGAKNRASALALQDLTEAHPNWIYSLIPALARAAE